MVQGRLGILLILKQPFELNGLVEIRLKRSVMPDTRTGSSTGLSLTGHTIRGFRLPRRTIRLRVSIRVGRRHAQDKGSNCCACGDLHRFSTRYCREAVKRHSKSPKRIIRKMLILFFRNLRVQ
jgi:hypothetical protein